MYLQSAAIQNFRGIRHLAINFERDTTVLIGENAWGKSSLLYALFAILGRGDQLCAFSCDDLYIPIKLARDTTPQVESSAPAAAVEPNFDQAPEAAVKTTAEQSPEAAAETTAEQSPEAAAETTAESSAEDASADTDAAHYDLSYLKAQHLEHLTPLKVLKTPTLERLLYYVPNPFGSGSLYRIVDVPCLGHNPGDRRGLIDCYLPSRPSSLYQPGQSAPPPKVNSAALRPLNTTLNRFVTWPGKGTAHGKDGSTYVEPEHQPKKPRAAVRRDHAPKLSALAQALYGDFADLHEGMLYEAQYEQSQPLYYKPTTSERMERTKQRLEPDSGLNPTARCQAEQDFDFACHDVFDAISDQIVIDLIFCESSYGALHQNAHLATLQRASYQGDDDLYRIHYRIRAQYADEVEPSPVGEVRLTCRGFVTVHELLDRHEHPIESPRAIISTLITLNPLLRLRDRRMLNSPFSHESAPPPVSASANAPAAAAPAAAAPSGPIEPSDMRAISHFFDDITSDDELTARKINEGLAVLNTIASKYLTNYQTTQLSGAMTKSEPQTPVRTAREIVATPISVGTLTSLKEALRDNKPSSSKFLLSLLAGALLMSQGQRPIDPEARPILVLEDIESRFHPTLLLNFWSILQTLPIQKIVTTNSAQFVSAISLHKLRRLCKQYYDVRCYQIGPQVFGSDDERKIAFHIRMIRPSALFARCWLMVEGETEVWILNEIANILGLNLACNGVHLIEFAQCGLNPLIKLAQQLGISYHVLTDGDEAGRHYAQTVREFAGGSSLADHLSVMPHIDIEHYLYTSGFANVYQRAANLELKPKRPNAGQLNISNKNLRAKINELLHNPSLKIYYLELDHVPYYTAPGYDPQRHKHPNQMTFKVDLDAAPQQMPQQKTQPKPAKAAPKRAPKRAPVKLSHHQLVAIIKTLIEHGLTKKLPSFNKIYNRSKLQRKVAHATSFKLEALSAADVQTFYSYLHSLITSMPHPSRGLTAKQSKYIQELKALRGKLLMQANTNRQRLQAQAQKNQNKERARALQAQAAAHPGKAVATEPQQALLTAHFDFISQAQGTVLGQPETQPTQLSEAQALLAHLTELASNDELDAKDLNRLRLLERDQGNSINEHYGALNDAALSQKGLSVNKVIEDAIHRKTKPGLAILVGEAMQQRGPECVPVLFKTMFRKIQRMAQNQYGLD